MQVYQKIYAAKDRIRRNQQLMKQAERMRDFSMVGRLRKESEQIRNEILQRYAVYIDF